MSIPYEPSKFVNRDEEIKFVDDLAKKLRDDLNDRKRARLVVFHSEKGSGKTWLALHLHRAVLPILGDRITPLLLRFVSPDERRLVEDSESQQTEKSIWYPDRDTWMQLKGKPESELVSKLSGAIITDLLKWLSEKLLFPLTTDTNLAYQTALMERSVRTDLREHGLILILDSVFEQPWQFLEVLESYVLGPLASLSNVLLIMTGRGRLYSWKSPDLKTGSVKTLEPFATEEIAAQIDKQAPGAVLSAKQIRDLGGGTPLTNLLLAQARDAETGLDQAIDSLLGENVELRPDFESLCVLDRFRDEYIALLQAVRRENPIPAEQPLEESRRLREKLTATYLVRWQDGAYVIDSSLRILLINYLQRAKPQMWKALNVRTAEMFEELAAGTPQWQEYFRKLAEQYRHAAGEVNGQHATLAHAEIGADVPILANV